MGQTKIATCCYCGTRAALVLNKERHELVCSSCGAPLHDLKMMRAQAADGASKKSKPAKPAKPEKATSKGRPADLAALYAGGKSKKKSYKKKRKKGFAARFFDEAFDVIEDIFD